MAKLKVYSVLDSKIGSFARPFFMHSRGEALRGFQEVANDPSTTISRHPGDFALMELAEFDEEKGCFINLSAPMNLGLASQYKNEPQAQAPLLDLMNKKPSAAMSAVQ